MICLLLFLATTPGLDDVGGQVCTEVMDSSDSVTEVVDRFRFDGINAAEAFVAALRFGLLGGSAITIEVDGISIGTAKSLLVSVGCIGGAVDDDLFGLVRIRIRRARVTLECIDETVLTSSANFLCFMRFPPSSFFLDSVAWWLISSSVVFPVGIFGRRFA